MTVQTPETDPPCCDRCGSATVRLGKLVPIGARPLVHVYKCKPCRQIMSIEEGPRNAAREQACALPQNQGSAIPVAPGI